MWLFPLWPLKIGFHYPLSYIVSDKKSAVFHCSLISVQLSLVLSCVWLFATPRLQHTRLPYPSPTPRACSNSCPKSQWWHPTISFSVSLPPLTFNLSQHQGLFQWVSSSHQVAKVLELQSQHQSFQWIFRTDFL